MNNLPQSWLYDRLKDLSRINRPALAATTDPDFEFDYLEISNVNYHGIIDPEAIERLRYEDAPSRARRCVDTGNTIISSVRPNLQAAAFIENGKGDLVCSTGFNVVEPFEWRLHSKYVYYALISEASRQYFEAAAKGVGYPAVDDKDFTSFNIPLPPLSDQKRIAAYLDASCAAIDTAVETKRRQIETFEALRKVIIQKVVTRGLDDHVALKPTGNHWLRQVPLLWKLTALKRVAILQTGLTLGKHYEGALIERPYLRVANVQAGHLDLENVKTIKIPESMATGLELRPNDVLMTEGGDLDKLGRGYLWEGQIPGCLHQNHIFAVRCFPHLLLPKFLTYLTDSTYGRDYFEATGKRTTNLATTNATKVGAFPIPLPSLCDQERLVEFLEDRIQVLRQLDETLKNQIIKLLSYRKSLIHECVTGKRRISEADVARVQEKATEEWRTKQK